MGKSDFAKKIFYIQIPIKRVAALSTTDIAMINELGFTESIIASCDIFRMSNEYLRNKYTEGKLFDLGSSMNENQEKVLEIHPDLLIKSAFGIEFLEKDRLIFNSNIPILYINNWQETSPLGRAEWIKLIGMMYGQEQKSDSVFAVIEKKYKDLQTKVANIKQKPIVLAGDMIKDVWYLPGGNSYVAGFIADAGGNYVNSKNTSTGSVPLSFEKILELSSQVTVWIGTDADSYKAMYKTNKMYELLPVCQKKNCFNNNKRKNKFGGNDYWETGSARPDYLLADLIKIFHPSVLPHYEMYFFNKLE